MGRPRTVMYPKGGKNYVKRWFPPGKPQAQAWHDLQRRNRFRDLYIRGMDAEPAAVLAGYSEQYAKRQSYQLAQRVLESLKNQAEIQGVTKQGLVKWLIENLSAQKPMWNQKTESWDYFDHFTAQLAAWDRLRGIIEPKPPEEINLNVRRGVDAPPPETYEQWLERTNRERAARGQLLLAAPGRPANGRPAGEVSGE